MYIVIEGQDATGKDTQASLLAEYFREQGREVVHYSESGTGSDDPFIREIARLNYGSSQNIDHTTRVMLYLVNRYEQWRKIAEPVLERDGIVITTRNWFSTLIYEGFGAGVSRKMIEQVHKAVMPEKYFNPDKIVVFTIPEPEQEKRLGTQKDRDGATRKTEVWKSKGQSFQQKLNNGYLEIIKQYHVPQLDASGTINEVFQDLKALFRA